MGAGERRQGLVRLVLWATALMLPGRAPLWAQQRPQIAQPDVRAAATSRPVAPATQPAEQLALNFKDTPLDAVLDYLSQVGGFTIVKEGPVDGRVTLISKQPVSRQEAVTMLNAALRANGFAAVPAGRELRISPRDKARKGALPVHFGADPADIPATDELITQVVPVKNIDAGKLKEDLKPLIGADTDVAANDGSNAIVITDSSANIKRLVEIISALDKQETTVSAMRVVQLKYANASAAVKLIETVFKEDAGGGGPQQGQPMQGPMPPQGPGGAGGGGSSHRKREKITAAADDRTNTIIIVGPADTLKTIDDILVKLDANPVPASEIKSFVLKFAEAEATGKLVSSIFHPQEQNNDDFPFFFPRFGSNNEQSSKAKVYTAFDDRTNTLIVTAPADAMKEIEALVRSLDANPASASAIKVYPLKYADSYSAAKLINSIFNPEPNDNNRRFIPFFIFGGGPSQPTRGAKINATSDDRTNAVIVTAPQETMKVIDGIVSQLDGNPGSEDTIFIYHLRNAQATNLEVVLNTLFGNIQNGQQNPNNAQQQQQQQQGENQFGNNGPGQGRGNANRLGNGQNSVGNRSRNNNRQNNGRSQLTPGALQAVNELTGQVLVVADPDTNSLIITTASKYEQEVRAIVAELDRPVPQVLIKVLVAEVTHDNNADFGLDYSILNTRPNGLGQSYTQSFGAPTGGLVAGLIEDKINATLHALAQQNKLDVLSRPYILASDNQQASILVGQDVPIVTSNSQTALGQTFSQYEYQAVGIILNVTPHINPEGLVILDVAPEISQLTAQTLTVGPGVNVPVIQDRSAQSRVAIKDGQTIVIGGLMQDQKTLTVNKVPILGDIPILKYAFSRTTVDKTKTELLIFLTPHVAPQPDLLRPMSQEELKGTRLTPNAVDPGTFDEHLRGMKRGEVPATQWAVPPAVFEAQPATQPANQPKSPTTTPSAEQTVITQ